MTDALIGHTGFVGSNLARQMHFDEFYGARGIEGIKGPFFDTVICAAAPGNKWYANENPNEDFDAILWVLARMRWAHAKTHILISTVDAISPRDPYGKHRADLENMAEFYFGATVIRLPALFGPGLKKNALYDLMHGQRLDEITPNAIYQWYPLRRLGEDIGRIREKGIRTINLVSEPIAMEEIRARFFPNLTIGEPRDNALNYNVPVEYPEFWLSKAEVMDEMGQFLAEFHGMVP